MLLTTGHTLEELIENIKLEFILAEIDIDPKFPF